MNIFYLDQDVDLAAQAHCDKHVVKMILETAQLLCSAHEKGAAPYKRTHYNHPCAVWARTDMHNYLWLIDLGLALCKEYTHRYGKRHKSQDVIEWCNEHFPHIPMNALTPFPQAMPDEHKSDDAVEAYRSYYRTKAESITPFRYTNRNKPSWLEA